MDGEENTKAVNEKPHRRADHPMEKEGFLKMASLGIFANLYNGSPGRDPHATARMACHYAEILWDEWIRRGIK